MPRPRLLDLFCKAGGASMGYHRAGFDVIGVDIEPQPNYPFEFHQADALTYPLHGYDAIHASPPCQTHSALAAMANAKPHPDLIPATRARLVAAGVPYVIENVIGAPLIDPVQLCGAAFALGTETHDLARHRRFECSFPVMAPPCTHRSRKVIGIYGDHARTARRHGAQSQYNAADSLRYGSQAMGIDWMTWRELAQAIPPAYTEHIGHYLLAAVR
jgi:DNA (cytosine-5)-methyltransferase 1